MTLRKSNTLLYHSDVRPQVVGSRPVSTAAYQRYRDYQGNIRVMREGELIQATNYYPYGMPIAGGTNPDEQRHKYSGKELLTHYGLNAYDYGPRLYDPALLQFHTPDPLREENPWNHSSLYCSANPIRFTDPTGLYEMQDLIAFLYYSLVAIFLPDSDDKATKMNLKAAEENHVPRIMVENKEDFKKAMDALNEMGISFGAIVFISHGNNDGAISQFLIGTEVIDSGTLNTDLEPYLNNKEVVIGSCWVGRGQSGDTFLRLFAEDTQAQAVYAACQPTRVGYKFDGTNSNDFQLWDEPLFYKMILSQQNITLLKGLTYDKYHGINYQHFYGNGKPFNLLIRRSSRPPLRFKTQK